jgi:hypothetical protein
METKMYIITLEWKNWQKRYYFEGEDSEDGKQKFTEVCRNLDPIGDNANDSNDFFQKAIEFFKQNGFIRIAK